MIKCTNVDVFYNDVHALNNISFSVDGPSITGVIGPNGAGKSTLLKSILNIIPHHGKVEIAQQASKKRLQNVAYVEQKSAIDFTFPITVSECVSLGLYPKLGVFRRMKPADWKKIQQALTTLGIADLTKCQISELSGGQFQRVLLARCLVQQAEYIFLDEPFVGIDAVSEDIIMATLRELKASGKTILIVHHDLSKVRDYFDHLIILDKALIAMGKTADVFTKPNLVKAYGDTIFVEGGV